MKRKLSGIFVRIKRDGKWESLDFTDLTETEMNTFLDERMKSAENNIKNIVEEQSSLMCPVLEYEWVRQLAIMLAQTVKELGDNFDLDRG